MNSQLDKVLCTKYPSLLLEHSKQKHNLFFFECGDGWFDIINAALGLIKKRSTTNNLRVTIVQVKEKFGTLRIYCSNGDEHTTTVTDIAELMSELTCELCGDKGSISATMGWNQSRCEIHKLNTTGSTGIPITVSNEYSSDLEAVIESILGLFGSNPQWALDWLKKPLLMLGSNKPYEMMLTIKGCSTLKNFIGKLEHGVLP